MSCNVPCNSTLENKVGKNLDTFESLLHPLLFMFILCAGLYIIFTLTCGPHSILWRTFDLSDQGAVPSWFDNVNRTNRMVYRKSYGWSYFRSVPKKTIRTCRLSWNFVTTIVEAGFKEKTIMSIVTGTGFEMPFTIKRKQIICNICSWHTLCLFKLLNCHCFIRLAQSTEYSLCIRISTRWKTKLKV